MMFIWMNAQLLGDWLFTCQGPVSCLYQGQGWHKPNRLTANPERLGWAFSFHPWEKTA